VRWRFTHPTSLVTGMNIFDKRDTCPAVITELSQKQSKKKNPQNLRDTEANPLTGAFPIFCG